MPASLVGHVVRGGETHDITRGRVKNLPAVSLHFVLDEGPLWGRGQVAIPVGAFNGMGDGIRLHLAEGDPVGDDGSHGVAETHAPRPQRRPQYG